MAAVYQLKIKYDQDKFEVLFLDARRPVSFPLEDKHAVNEHHVARKSHDRRHTEKMSSRAMHHGIGLKQTRGIKYVTLKSAKKFVGVAAY